MDGDLDFEKRRRSTRQSLFLGAKIEFPDWTGDGRIRNISSTGAFLETGENLDVGERIIISFRGVDRVAAVVKRRNAKGFGIEFETEINPSAYRAPSSKAEHSDNFILNLREGARREIWNNSGDNFKRPSTR